MLMQTSTGGSITVSKRVRLTDEQLRRARAIQFHRMKLEGLSTREIAIYFSFTPRFVNRELRSVPGWQKARIGALCG
jgi:hypothetical protein